MRIRKDFDQELGDDIQLIAKVSDALAHPVRLHLFRYIMKANREGALVCTGTLVDEFGYAQATISQHMKKLVDSGLVTVDKRDRYSFYYTNLGLLAKYIDSTKKFSVQ